MNVRIMGAEPERTHALVDSAGRLLVRDAGSSGQASPSVFHLSDTVTGIAADANVDFRISPGSERAARMRISAYAGGNHWEFGFYKDTTFSSQGIIIGEAPSRDLGSTTFPTLDVLNTATIDTLGDLAFQGFGSELHGFGPALTGEILIPANTDHLLRFTNRTGMGSQILSVSFDWTEE